MSSPRHDRLIRFMRCAIIGVSVSILAIGCCITFLVTEHEALRAGGVVLMVVGQVTIGVHLSGRTRDEEARRMRQ
ncbi:hypothetical protein C5E16_14890 [Clavibacter michiganensis]|uniref:Lipoprotein n=1 Tax=Clavibacter michiganensis TaxID=28447 RepID=A0A2S5VLY8_9MICO|nr:hypothetical protein [Clavibacter michiganensis]PPF63897.1 hypothetical protein C5E16_14890 [Clavibacter michiganensis]